MNTILEHLTGLNTMTDQVVAMDFLISLKTGVRNYAVAITEAATPELRQTLDRQMEDAIAMHERMTAYMMQKGWYHPYNPVEQIQLDLKNIQTALAIPSPS